MKEPVDHIIRPQLPWRQTGAMTECGYDAAKVKAITREEFSQRLKDLGRQRTAMLTCMTCADTSSRWQTWEQDPRLALGREITWETGGGYRGFTERGERLKDELLAVADLIAADPDKFDALVAERQQRREWNERKVEAAKRNAARKAATTKTPGL